MGIIHRGQAGPIAKSKATEDGLRREPEIAQIRRRSTAVRLVKEAMWTSIGSHVYRVKL